LLHNQQKFVLLHLQNSAKAMEILYKSLIINRMGGGNPLTQAFAYPLSKTGLFGFVLDFFCLRRFASLRAKRGNPEQHHFWIASSFLLAMTRSACKSKALNR